MYTRVKSKIASDTRETLRQLEKKTDGAPIIDGTQRSPEAEEEEVEENDDTTDNSTLKNAIEFVIRTIKDRDEKLSFANVSRSLKDSSFYELKVKGTLILMFSIS